MQLLDTLGAPSYDQQASVQQHYAFERSPSPNGSIDPILSGRGYHGKTKTEVSVGLHDIPDEDSDTSKQDEIAALPPGWVRPHYRGDV